MRRSTLLMVVAFLGFGVLLSLYPALTERTRLRSPHRIERPAVRRRSGPTTTTTTTREPRQSHFDVDADHTAPPKRPDSPTTTTATDTRNLTGIHHLIFHDDIDLVRFVRPDLHDFDTLDIDDHHDDSAKFGTSTTTTSFP